MILYDSYRYWVEIEGENAKIGITSHYEEELGLVAFIDLPRVGSQLIRGEATGAVESEKVATELFSPLSGLVLSVNEKLESNPELINEAPTDSAWLYEIEMTDKTEVAKLIREPQLEKSLEGE